jgi:biotin-dependent carboxylase-like uncharacterized protein
MSLHVTQANFLALVQDYGRYGYQNMGVTTGGPLDEHAFLWANYLLDNHYNDAQIEISYGAFSAVFTEPTVIAICGADLSATLNGQRILPWHTYNVNAGDEICFVRPLAGLRCYLAVNNGFSVAHHVSSCATVMREKIGGLDKKGAPLVSNNDVLYQACYMRMNRRVPAQFIPQYTSKVTVRYIPNVLVSPFSELSQQLFSQKVYTVTSMIDRMAYRLSGEPIDAPTTKVISHGVSLGAIQVPSNGQPIVLMKDHQTMGGYPLLGCVVYLDIAVLAQAAPETTVSFVPVAVNDVEAELMTYKRFFNITF